MSAARVGVAILPEDRWEVAAGMWRRVEELGFDHGWTYDHLAWRSLRDRPWFSAIPTLSAAATVTTRIPIGPLVASINFRHPVPFARELLALDDISGGRLLLGIGAGGEGWDATMLGHAAWSRGERGARFVEFVTLLDLLLRQEATDWRGRYYAADGARSIPGCVQQPRIPFAIAATGPKGMRLAVEHATTWVTTGDRTATGGVPPETGAAIVGGLIARLEEVCAEAGRDPATIDRLVLLGPELDPGLTSPTHFAEVRQAYEEVGVTDLVIPWPRRDEPYAGDPSILERIL